MQFRRSADSGSSQIVRADRCQRMKALIRIRPHQRLAIGCCIGGTGWDAACSTGGEPFACRDCELPLSCFFIHGERSPVDLRRPSAPDKPFLVMLLTGLLGSNGQPAPTFKNRDAPSPAAWPGRVDAAPLPPYN